MEKIDAGILIIDDDPAVLTSAKLFLKQKFRFVKTLPSPQNIEHVLSDTSIDLILLDMNYSKGENDGLEGLAIIDRVVKEFSDLEIIPITAYGEIDLAVKAMKKGARDFITKPWQNEKLLSTIINVLNLKRANNQILELKDANSILRQSSTDIDPIIGKSRAIQSVLSTIHKVAPTEANILILGENGTGKELVAMAIHNQSNRRDQAFIKIDLGSLSESLFESELFGHLKGSFTDAKEDRIGKFQAANGGTLFLDEIGNINKTQQSKLLSVLQKKTVTKIGSNKEESLDIRLISATNQDLHEVTKQDEFRQDLLYRINTIEIPLPSLRERIDDLPEITAHFLNIFKKKYQKSSVKISNETLKALKEYHWPGNVRELKHSIERAVIMSEDPILTPHSFQFGSKEELGDSLDLKEMEKRLILKALEKNKGNITHAAKDLGIDRLALYRRLEKYGL